MSLKKDFSKKAVPGDTHERQVCSHCEHVDYENPKLVNVAVIVHDGKILLCRRGIPSRIGFWGLPGGFMEQGETIQEGAARETIEEAGAKINVGSLIGVYHTHDKKHVIMVFRADMPDAHFESGPESLETKLFDWKDIPWNELAFPMTKHALEQYDRTKHLADVVPEILVLPPLYPPKPAAPKP